MPDEISKVVALNHKFHSQLPTGCPTIDAVPFAGQMFRGVPNPPLSEAAFLSHRELDKQCDASECECWGLSVWLSLEAVQHARKAIRPIRLYWEIAAGDVVPQDGVIKHTPNRKQPQHHTFWRDTTQTLVDKFTVVVKPDNQ